MKNIAIAVVAACLTMLVTSGIVAFATAATVSQEASIEGSGPSEAEVDLWLSSVIDLQYQRAVADRR